MNNKLHLYLTISDEVQVVFEFQNFGLLVSIYGKVKIIVVWISLLYFYTNESEYMILKYHNISYNEQ